MMSGEPNVGVFIDDHKRRADTDLNAPPYDDLRNYAYEGGGSTAGSLSSLASGASRVLTFHKSVSTQRVSFLTTALPPSFIFFFNFSDDRGR